MKVIMEWKLIEKGDFAVAVEVKPWQILEA